jgi:voltage-gated potassium channel
MQEARQPRVTIWQCLMLFLSAYVLFALFAEAVFPLPSEIARLLNVVDTAVCGVFAADFLLQLKTAKR